MVLYPNKLPESERVCSGICNQFQKWVISVGLVRLSILVGVLKISME